MRRRHSKGRISDADVMEDEWMLTRPLDTVRKACTGMVIAMNVAMPSVRSSIPFEVNRNGNLASE